MSDNPQETKQPKDQDHSHDSGWLSRLNDLQKILAAIAAVVVAVGALGTAAYVARDSWDKVFGGPPAPGPAPASPTTRTSPPAGTPASLTPTTPATSPAGRDASGPTSATLAPGTPSPPGSPVPAPRQPDALGHGHISGVTSTGRSCAGPVTVTIAISSPASAGRELWLMAIVMTGTPVHPVYYAKKELDNVAGQQMATIQFYGATNGSARNLVIVSSARASFSWLKQNLANDGNPAWDTNRTTKPSDVPVVSPFYDVTTRC